MRVSALKATSKVFFLLLLHRKTRNVDLSRQMGTESEKSAKLDFMLSPFMSPSYDQPFPGGQY